MMKWLIHNWYKATVFAAIYSLIFISLFVYERSFALFLIWIHVPVYLLHESEEFVFPGGFPEMMMEGMAGKGYEVSSAIMRAGFWVNVPFIFLGFPIVAALSTLFGLSWGMYVVYFTLIATVPHFVTAVATKKLYNPGIFASVFLNLPVAGYTIYYFVSNDLVPASAHVIGAALAIGAMIGPMVFQIRKAAKEVALEKEHGKLKLIDQTPAQGNPVSVHVLTHEGKN